MKPNFALTLSFDGIGLLHRVPGGWHTVGEVTLDTADLAAELSALRRMAIQLDTAGLRSKLVIPNEQIRYLRIPAPPKGSDVAAHVARALDGTTPYAVADLRFDWIVVGDALHVAAVARETLEEAEAFAGDHDFCPVSFVAIPATDSFPGEPCFGQTTAAARLIDPADRLMRDTHAIRILGRAELPTPPLAGTAPDATPEPAPKVEDLTPPPAESVQTDTETAASPPDSAAAPDAEPAPLPAFSSRRSRTEPQVAIPSPDAAAPAAIPADPAPSSLISASLTSPAADPTPPDPLASAPDAPPRRPMVAELPPLPNRPVKAPKPVTPAEAADAGKRTTPPLTTAAPTQPIPDAPRMAPPTPDPALRPTAFRSAPPAPARDEAAARLGLATLLARFTGKRAETPEAALAAGPAQPRASRPILSEKQRLTIFGARRTEGDAGAIRGKPRFMGLILTGILLVFLAAVAAWSAIFTEAGLKGLFGPRETAIATTPDTTPAPDPALTADILTADPADGALDLARLDDTDTLSNLPDADIDGTAALTDPDTDPRLIPEADLTQTPAQAMDAALASYAATGIWQISPAQPDTPPSTTLDDLYLASIDTRLQNFDAVALPDARTQTDDRPAAQSSPAPPGTTFDLDARGLVIATPEGAATPEGVIVFAGRPALTPAGRPTRFAETPDADAQPEPELAGTRPRLRPETLVESNERAQLGGLSRNELADVRPRLRPEAAAAVALALREAGAATAAAAASVAAIDDRDEAEADEADALAGATDQAIASSLKPLARPRDFRTTVQNTREAQEAPAQEAPAQVASAAALSAPRSAAPQIPSSASVAQQATVRGAINLRQVNLIGVYGQPSNRRALVRLSNGRYQKVQVGDRLDGGQVRAIGENELSYVKGNRAIVLTMPQG